MRRSIRILLLLFVVLTIGYFGVHYWVTSKIETALHEKLPKAWNVEYTNLNFNLFSGSIVLKDFSIQLQDSAAALPYLNLVSDKLGIYELSYSEFLESKNLDIKRCELRNPSISYQPFARKTDSLKKTTPQKAPTFSIASLRLSDGDFQLFSKSADSVTLGVERFDLELTEVLAHSADSLSSKPFAYTAFQLDVAKITAPLGTYETMEIDQGRITQDSLQFTDFTLKTILDPEAFTKELKIERDHYNLTISKIHGTTPHLQNQEGEMTMGVPFLHIEAPNFEVYRDKLLPDDFSTKTLFNEKFRNLPFALKLDSLSVTNGFIKYIEKDSYANEGGTIEFHEMNLNALHVGNGYPEGTMTNIEGQGRFMKHAPLQFQWQFDTQSETDRFTFSAEINDMPAADINPLTGNNLNVFFDGQISECRFSINGNKYHSIYDFNIKYHDLNVQILNRKKGKTSWLGTKLANLLLKKNSKTKKSSFRRNRGKVTRIQSKSFFNYIWRNVEDGLIHTVI